MTRLKKKGDNRRKKTIKDVETVHKKSIVDKIIETDPWLRQDKTFLEQNGIKPK